MSCPGTNECVYGERCPLQYAERPPRWTPCELEIERWHYHRLTLMPWLEEAHKRPKIVDPEWMLEVARAFLEAQMRQERFQRYVRGMELEPLSADYQRDPVVQRFERRVTDRAYEFRFYLHDLITVLRRAKAEDRYIPFPGHRTRRAWWEGQPSRSKRRKKAGTSPKPGPERRQAAKVKRRRPKVYRSHRIKTWIMDHRRRSAGGTRSPCSS